MYKTALWDLETLCEKYPNTEFFLVRIFPHSDWMRWLSCPKKNKYLSSIDNILGILNICTFYRACYAYKRFVQKSFYPELFCKKAALKSLTKCTGKALFQKLLFKKFAALACNFSKKETLAQLFSCEFQEMFKNTFF